MSGVLRGRLERDPEYLLLVVTLVLVWGVFDGTSTLAAASVAGLRFEANPLVRTFLAAPLMALALKIGVALLAGGLALLGERFVRTVPGWRAWFGGLIGVGLGVTVTNLLVAFA